MASWCYGASRKLRPLLVALLLSAAALTRPAAAADETLTVRMDQARIVRLPEHIATIVVGNPLIADVSLQQGGLMVVTGKGYGTTNLVTLDRNGVVLSDQLIQVRGPGDGVVVVYRGGINGSVLRESYSCTPVCERRITLGDSPDFFGPTVQQTVTRNDAVNRTAGSP